MFWHPKYKWQLVEWFNKRYPGVSTFRRMRYKQLYTIYMKLRNEK